LRFLSLLFIFFITLNASDAEDIRVSSQSISNGRTLFIEFKNSPKMEYKSVQVAKKEFQIFQHPLKNDKSYALIPFSYYEKIEEKTLSISYEKLQTLKKRAIKIEVIDGNYTQEKIHVSSDKVNPRSKKVQERISKEYAEAMKIYATVTPKNYITKPFILPLHSKITSDFGKARVYNGSLKGYHSGTDFRAKVGTAIVASNDAEVALVKKRFYSGGTVLLNHGEGIYTCYFHMSKFQVKKGDLVKRGDILGLSGKSGRVTGPHLHFSARINGVQVDPLQLIELLNKNLLTRK